MPLAAPAAASPRNLWIGYGCAALGAALFSTKANLIKLAYAEGINAETLLALWMSLRQRARIAQQRPVARLMNGAGDQCS